MKLFGFSATGWMLLAFLLLTGCSDAKPPAAAISVSTEAEGLSEGEPVPESEPESEQPPAEAEPRETEADWTEYFGNLNGAAVIYAPEENSYRIYNRELALTRRSPCSTFKIISSLTALEEGIIGPENSKRTWSGETFWNEKWNQDMAFPEAFGTSCVWYYRKLIDEIGKDRMKAELDKLQYGNCDSSDWEGSLNTNNRNPALTGFWIESSLQISPMEQTQVLERIFGGASDYREETKEQLMQVMAVPEIKEPGILMYGKTGMGKQQGIVVDAWFTGFADVGQERIYFCVYLGETQGGDVSGTRAKEIAVSLVSDYQK